MVKSRAIAVATISKMWYTVSEKTKFQTKNPAKIHHVPLDLTSLQYRFKKPDELESEVNLQQT